MESSIKRLPKSQVEITIDVLVSEFQAYYEKAILRLGQNIELEGFRKGKAPKEIIEEKIGKDKILKEAQSLAIEESYLKSVFKNKIEPIGSPEVEILTPARLDGDLSFKVKAAVLPEINLPNYKSLAESCEKSAVSVADTEIEDAIIWLQRSRAKLSQRAQPAQEGDFVEIEFSSPDIKGGEKQNDGFLLGQGHLIPDFEKNLEGMISGSEKKISLQFPKEHFQKDLAGRNLDCQVKMLSVKKVELPEINDDFVRSIGNFENLEALKRNIKQGLMIEKETQESQRVRQEILQRIIKEISWDMPDVLIEAERINIYTAFKIDIKNKLQMEFGDYLKSTGKTEEELGKSFRQDAEKRIKESLILNKISIEENIQVSEEEIKEETNKSLAKYPSAQEAKKELDLVKLKFYIENEIKNEKTLQLLENFSKINPKK